MSARDDASASSDAAWQERLLPFMQRLLVGLTLFFLLVSLVQFGYLQWSSRNGGAVLREAPRVAASAGDTFQTDLTNARLALEFTLIERRYERADALLELGLWTRYLGFSTGMILALLGASFVLGKLRTSESSGELGVEGMRLAVRSASPGVVMTFLGTVLMVVVMTYRVEINVTDASIYLDPQGGVGVEWPVMQAANIEARAE